MDLQSAQRGSSSRSAAIDAARVLGIVAVVAGHVWGDTAVGTVVYPWHVPLFFLLTGYLWTGGRTFRTELAKRWATLGRPYVVWLVILLAALCILLKLGGNLHAGALLGPLYGGGLAIRPFTTFWFVSVLFFSALLYRLVERLPLWSQWAIAAAGLAVAYLDGTWLSTTPLGIGLAVPCLSFVLAGRLFRAHRHSVRHPAVVGTALIVVAAILVASSISPRLDIKNGNFGVPVLGVVVGLMIDIGLVLVLEAVMPRLPGWFSRLSIRLAAGGMLVVLAHPAVLWLLNTPEHGRKLGFLAALTIPWALSLIVLRTPLAPWLTGVNRISSPRAKTRV
ncbi:MAG TPA: acyltransferase family protein [Lacisediminihabitans sp.]|uniref:acyltransferase family protein n=1 Tax=Lacisediminihabitans sp. TaxID=2787631 RepID=UPI002ED97CDF